MKKALCVLLLLAACGGGGGSGPGDPAPPAGPSPADTLAAALQGLPLDEFYFESFGALLKRSPETVVWQALEAEFPLDAVELDDLSEAYVRDTFEMYAVVLSALQGYDRSVLTPEQQLDFDFYAWYLQDHVDQLGFFWHGFPAAYSIFGVQNDTQRFFTDIHPLETPGDAENYVTRLQRVARKFRQLAEHLRKQRQNGIVEPALTMNVAIGQVAALAQTAAQDHPYYTAFVQRLAGVGGLSVAERQDLESRARAAVGNSVIPAYRDLLETLRDLLNNAPPIIGVHQYPGGRAYYARALRHHTTTDLGAAEIHQLGLDHLARIRAEMRLLFDQLGYPQDESLQELFARVAADGGVVPAADVLPAYAAIIDETESRLGEAFDLFPSADVVVLPDPFGGFYIGPSFDGQRPGAFYAGTSEDQPWFRMRALAYHEAIPGHHTQIAIQMEQDVPVFRKVARVTAFVEGWALYAERLAWELGWYGNDPYADLGRLQYEALRAARLVMDTGIHDLGWSFAEAAQFNADNVGWSVSESQGAAARYSVWPGQATAYMIGMLRILDERQRAMDTLGQDFDLTAFHRALLSGGAVPLDLLTVVVDRYIAEEQAAP